jgi:hypothetical protein
MAGELSPVGIFFRKNWQKNVFSFGGGGCVFYLPNAEFQKRFFLIFELSVFT